MVSPANVPTLVLRQNLLYLRYVISLMFSPTNVRTLVLRQNLLCLRYFLSYVFDGLPSPFYFHANEVGYSAL